MVYKAQDLKNKNRIVALKMIRLAAEDEGIPATAIREISLLKEMQHENVLSLLTIVHTDTSKLYLVCEYLDMDLKKFMESIPLGVGLGQDIVRKFMVQLLRGIRFCHGRRILHRDLKPQNLLINQDGNLKIADFGLARSFGIPMRVYTHDIVTLWYRAPEVLLGCRNYSLGIDMWAIGCIFAEMITRKALFPGDSEIDEIFKIFRVLGTPDDEVWPGVTTLKNFKPTFPQWKPRFLSSYVPGIEEMGTNLLESLLKYNPETRISAKLALCHPYFTVSAPKPETTPTALNLFGSMVESVET